MVRCFIGVFLPEILKPKVLEVQNFIKSLDIDCKFVEPANIHITFSFLGDVADEELPSLKDRLDSVCNKLRKTAVTVAGVKLIPSEKFVRVIALDVNDDTGMLSQISNEIKSSVGGDTKPPHLTLCRVRDAKGKNIASQLLNIDSYCGQFQMYSMQLIQSQLGRSGPVYTILHESKLD
ncbi:MAG: RNA 2',3'-cyclic phosphodiesterase [Candidatus Aenigmarchaeota archaeon]|nr:RNA 2',3'-cyclic phosphodiesterase [Candidatus Aenigmarchaeota archaeon]